MGQTGEIIGAPAVQQPGGQGRVGEESLALAQQAQRAEGVHQTVGGARIGFQFAGDNGGTQFIFPENSEYPQLKSGQYDSAHPETVDG